MADTDAIHAALDLAVRVAGRPTSLGDLAAEDLRRMTAPERHQTRQVMQRALRRLSPGGTAAPRLSELGTGQDSVAAILGFAVALLDAPDRAADVIDPGPPSRSLVAALKQLSAAPPPVATGPGLLSGEDFAARIGLSRQRLNDWRRAGRILGIEAAKRGFRYPEWQIGRDGRILPDIPAILAALIHPFAAYRFLTTPLDALGGATPAEALHDGEGERVVGLAEAAGRGDHL